MCRFPNKRHNKASWAVMAPKLEVRNPGGNPALVCAHKSRHHCQETQAKAQGPAAGRAKRKCENMNSAE